MNVLKKIDAAGQLAPASALDHPIVLQENAGLMWSTAPISDKRLTADQEDAALAAVTLGGFTDWRRPTVEELFLVHDRSRCDPAIDTDFFTCPPGWYRSSSPAAWAPDGFVWVVNSGYGSASDGHRDYTAWLRVVRSVSSPVSGQ